MTEVISRNEFDKSYLLIKKEETEETYVFKMLIQNSIPGLLNCKIRYIEETEYLAYDVTAKRSLEKAFSDKKMDFIELTELFYGINKVMHSANDYLLNRNGFWLSPKYIYMDLEIGELYCLYYPVAKANENNDEEKYRKLADFLLDRIDHRDEHAVNLVYHFYKISKEEYFSFDSFIGFMEKECLLVHAKKQKEEKVENRNEIRECEEKDLIIDDNLQKNNNIEDRIKWWGVISIFFLGVILVLGYFVVPILHEYTFYILVPGITFMGLAVGLLIRNLVYVYKEKNDYSYIEKQEPVRIEEYFDDVSEDVTVFFDQDKFIQLKWKEGHFSKEYTLDKFPVTVGKMKNSVQMVMEDSSVSRLHARFRQQGSMVYLQDLDSTNGTFVNHERLFPGEEIIIKRGDEIEFGKIIVNVV